MARLLKSFFGNTKSEQQVHAPEQEQWDLFFSIPSWRGWTEGYGMQCCGTSTAIDKDHWGKYTWIVPPDTTTARFHLWGGGGSGAVSHCCQQGVPGGSGAYAFKDVLVSPGDCYTFCVTDGHLRKCVEIADVGGVTDAGAGTVSRGLRGMKAYVTGTGLTNFCAEGGNPGAVRCQSIIATANTCCCATVKMCHIVCRRTVDSANDVFAPAKYYGADGGSEGMYGCYQFGCCNHTGDMNANHCGDKRLVPFPGGIPYWEEPSDVPAIGGGFISVKQCDIIENIYGTMAAQAASYHWMGTCSATSFATVWGMGGLSQSTCGGTCCCGQMGGIPMIRVSYS